MVHYKSEESRQKVLEARNKGNETLRKRALEKYYTNPSYCFHCKKIIEIKEGERACIVKKKKFCDSSCAAKNNNTKRKTKIFCKNCGKLCRKNAKIYCSRVCQQEFTQNKRIDNWKTGIYNGSEIDGDLSRPIRSYLLKKANYSCEECGWSKINLKTGVCPLTIHHKDGNYKHNSEDNLQVLCPNCHSLTETYGGSNHGNGRKHRYNQDKQQLHFNY